MNGCCLRTKEEALDTSGVDIKLSPLPSNRCYTYCPCCSPVRCRSFIRSCASYHQRKLLYYSFMFFTTLSLMFVADALFIRHQNTYLNSWIIFQVLLGNGRKRDRQRFLYGESHLRSQLSAAIVGTVLIVCLHCALSVTLTHGWQYIWIKVCQSPIGQSLDNLDERRQSSSSNGIITMGHIHVGGGHITHHNQSGSSLGMGGMGKKHTKNSKTISGHSTSNWRRTKAEEFERTRRQRKKYHHSKNGTTVFGLSSTRMDISISTTVDDRNDSIIYNHYGSSQDDDDDDDGNVEVYGEEHELDGIHYPRKYFPDHVHNNTTQLAFKHSDQNLGAVHHTVIEDEDSLDGNDDDEELGDRFDKISTDQHNNSDSEEDEDTRILHAGSGLTITVGGRRSGDSGGSASDSAGGTLKKKPRGQLAKRFAGKKYRSAATDITTADTTTAAVTITTTVAPSSSHLDVADEEYDEDSGGSVGGRSPLSTTDDEKLLAKPKVMRLISVSKTGASRTGSKSKGRGQTAYLSVDHLNSINNSQNNALREPSLTGASDLTGLTYL